MALYRGMRVQSWKDRLLLETAKLTVDDLIPSSLGRADLCTVSWVLAEYICRLHIS